MPRARGGPSNGGCVRKQRLVTAAVAGVVATGVGTITAAASPLARPADRAPTTIWVTPGLSGIQRVGALAPLRSVTGLSRTAVDAGTIDATADGPPSGGAPALGPNAGPAGPTPGASAAAPDGHTQPLVIAHRGASAYRAEETLDSYRLAIAEGADYIEADLVITKDGVLVARHENDLSDTTDVASHPEFADRRTSKTINGVTTTGWFAEDFTLAELRTLTAVPRGHHRTAAPIAAQIPTLAEVIALARAQGRPTGLYLELKTPAYFTSIGLAPEPALVDALRANGLTGTHAGVFVESFEAASLRQVHTAVDVPEIQLVGGQRAGDPSMQPAGLAKIHGYAVGVGIDRARLGDDGTAARSLVDRVHAAGLQVHVFTFGADRRTEYTRCFDLGVDGVFSDNPDLAVQARRDTTGGGASGAAAASR